MACDWGLLIADRDGAYARHAARAAFDEVDRLEQELSRFIDSSDVALLNSAPPGRWSSLGPDAFDCLRIALRMHHETEGAFDPTLGRKVDAFRRRADGSAAASGGHSDSSASAPSGLPTPAALGNPLIPGRLELDLPGRRARRLCDDAVVDLGALGKGYAIDCAVDLLKEWSIGAALLNSGQSTVYALGMPHGQSAWRVGVRDPNAPDQILAEVSLRDAALSGSGNRLHGRHIIDPQTGSPAEGPSGTWAIAPSAAESDALSTAFMILTSEAIERVCGRDGARKAAIRTPDGLAWIANQGRPSA
jgi:thiamine biosynthesis lipoprotein